MSQVQSSRNPSEKPRLIVLAGPAASGMTGAAVNFAGASLTCPHGRPVAKT